MKDEIVEKRVKYITTRVNKTNTDDINDYYPFFRALARITSNYYVPVQTISKYYFIYLEETKENDMTAILNSNLYTCNINRAYKTEFMAIQNKIVILENKYKIETNIIKKLHLSDQLKREDYELLHIPLQLLEDNRDINVKYILNKGFSYIKH